MKRNIGDLVPPLLAVLLVGVAMALTLLPLDMSLADAMGVSANRP